MAVGWCRCNPKVPLPTLPHLWVRTYVHARSPITISHTTFQAYSRLTVSPSPDTISTRDSRDATSSGTSVPQCLALMFAMH